MAGAAVERPFSPPGPVSPDLRFSGEPPSPILQQTSPLIAASASPQLAGKPRTAHSGSSGASSSSQSPRPPPVSPALTQRQPSPMIAAASRFPSPSSPASSAEVLPNSPPQPLIAAAGKSSSTSSSSSSSSSAASVSDAVHPAAGAVAKLSGGPASAGSQHTLPKASGTDFGGFNEPLRGPSSAAPMESKRPTGNAPSAASTLSQLRASNSGAPAKLSQGRPPSQPSQHAHITASPPVSGGPGKAPAAAMNGVRVPDSQPSSSPPHVSGTSVASGQVISSQDKRQAGSKPPSQHLPPSQPKSSQTAKAPPARDLDGDTVMRDASSKPLVSSSSSSTSSSSAASAAKNSNFQQQQQQRPLVKTAELAPNEADEEEETPPSPVQAAMDFPVFSEDEGRRRTTRSNVMILLSAPEEGRRKENDAFMSDFEDLEAVVRKSKQPCRLPSLLSADRVVQHSTALPARRHKRHPSLQPCRRRLPSGTTIFEVDHTLVLLSRAHIRT